MLDPALSGGPRALDEASYFLTRFLTRIELQPGRAATMARWRKRLFVATSRLAADDPSTCACPPGRTVIIGSRIDV